MGAQHLIKPQRAPEPWLRLRLSGHPAAWPSPRASQGARLWGWGHLGGMVGMLTGGKPSWRLSPSAQTAPSFHAKQISHYFDFPSSSVTVALSFWSHCVAPEATCLVSHPERFPVLAFPAPPSHIPPSQPLSLCHSPPAFALLYAHASWHWHRLGTLFLCSKLSQDPRNSCPPVKVCIRFSGGLS